MKSSSTFFEEEIILEDDAVIIIKNPKVAFNALKDDRFELW